MFVSSWALFELTMASKVEMTNSNSKAFVKVCVWNKEKPISSEALWKLARENQFEISEKQLQKEINGLGSNDEVIQFTLLSGVPRATFMEMAKDAEYGIRPSFIPTSDSDAGPVVGDIVVSEKSCRVLDVAVDYLLRNSKKKLNRGQIAQDYTLADGRIKIPDAMFTRKGATQTGHMVIKVAYADSLVQLRNDIQDWATLCKNFGAAIGIKIFALNEHGQRKMIILYADREGMTQEIEFGIAKHPQPLRIPIYEISDCDSDEEENEPHVSIWLLPLREIILKHLKIY